MTGPRYGGLEVEVTITVAGDTTVATAIVYGDGGAPVLSESATSRRHSGDKQNDVIGINYAVGRVLTKIGKKLTKVSDGLVKHADDTRTHKRKSAEERKAAAKRSESSKKAAATRKRNREKAMADKAKADMVAQTTKSVTTATSVLDSNTEPTEALREM